MKITEKKKVGVTVVTKVPPNFSSLQTFIRYKYLNFLFFAIFASS